MKTAFYLLDQLSSIKLDFVLLSKLSFRNMHITSRLHLFPRPIPEIHSDSVAPVSHSSSMQVLLTLSYTEHQFRFYQPAPARGEAFSRYGFRLPGTTTLPPRRLSSCLPVACFSGYSSAYRVLSPILGELGFSDPRERRALVKKIASQVSKIVGGVTWVSRNRNVLPLEMEIVREKKFVITGQDLMVERAIRESRMEYERNHGMVPTAKEALKLKCVKVQKEKKDQETEDCTICFEELTDFAASMPCNHLFHGTCIAKWLKTSHYCPVCRYEMPTDR